MRTLVALAIFTCIAGDASAELTICGSADNDLVRALPAADVLRVQNPVDAIARAKNGSAVLILADGYPETQTALPADFFDRAREKDLSLYVEYPASLPGIQPGPPQRTTWERGVIASDCFGSTLPKLRI